jgi:hypothetical protein
MIWRPRDCNRRRTFLCDIRVMVDRWQERVYTWDAGIPDGVEVGAVTVECYINSVPSNIQGFVVKRLVYIADKLDPWISIRAEKVCIYETRMEVVMIA